jgi:hypothetical protein
MFEFKVKGRTLEEAKNALLELSLALGQNTPTLAVKNVEVSVPVVEEEYTTEDLAAVHAPVVTEEAPTVVDMNEVDAQGYPWDERIHASSRAKIGDGTWRIKRGVTDEQVAKIQAQTPRNMVGAKVVAEVAKANEVLKTEEPHKPLVLNAPAPLPTMSSGHTLETFKANFPMVIGGLITEGKVTPQYINELKTYFKVDQIWAISDEQKTEVFKSFVEYGLIQQVG